LRIFKQINLPLILPLIRQKATSTIKYTKLPNVAGQHQMFWEKGGSEQGRAAGLKMAASNEINRVKLLWGQEQEYRYRHARFLQDDRQGVYLQRNKTQLMPTCVC
jgi:hypothetical protein